MSSADEEALEKITATIEDILLRIENVEKMLIGMNLSKPVRSPPHILPPDPKDIPHPSEALLNGCHIPPEIVVAMQLVKEGQII